MSALAIALCAMRKVRNCIFEGQFIHTDVSPSFRQHPHHLGNTPIIKANPEDRMKEATCMFRSSSFGVGKSRGYIYSLIVPPSQERIKHTQSIYIIQFHHPPASICCSCLTNMLSWSSSDLRAWTNPPPDPASPKT